MHTYQYTFKEEGWMMIDDKKMSKPLVQNILMENRERMSISGVLDVESFDEESVVVETEMGTLVIKG